MTDAILNTHYSQMVWWHVALLPPPVSRALGIPCRVVTNFGSAHDSNANLMIEKVHNISGEIISDNDSIWWVCISDDNQVVINIFSLTFFH